MQESFVKEKPIFVKGTICQYLCLIKLHTPKLRYAHTVAAVPMTHEIVRGELVQGSTAMSTCRRLIAMPCQLLCQLSAPAMIVAALLICHEIAQRRRLAMSVAAPLICHESAQGDLVQGLVSAVMLRSLCVRSLQRFTSAKIF